MNCVIALNVVCCEPVAVSPAAWVRPAGVSVAKTMGIPPLLSKKFESAFATFLWLPFRPGNCDTQSPILR